jgi:hypothetical protein
MKLTKGKRLIIILVIVFASLVGTAIGEYLRSLLESDFELFDWHRIIIQYFCVMLPTNIFVAWYLMKLNKEMKNR